MRSTTTVVASKEDQSLMMNQSAVMSVFFCAIQSDGRWYRAEVIENENHPDIVVSRLDKDLFGIDELERIRRVGRYCYLLRLRRLGTIGMRFLNTHKDARRSGNRLIHKASGLLITSLLNCCTRTLVTKR